MIRFADEIGPRPGWHRDAACKSSALDFTNTQSRPNVKACLELCGRCIVRVDCLRWAVEVEDSVAILGGCDGPARKPLIRERQRQLEEQRQLELDEQEMTE